MLVKINFRLSAAARERELIATGQRGNTDRSVSAEFPDLSVQERAIAVKCGRDLGNGYEVRLARMELLDSPRSQGNQSHNWLNEEIIVLDEIPTVSEALTMAEWQHMANSAVIRESQDRAGRVTQELAEKRGRNLTAYHALHTQLYHPQSGLITTGNLTALRNFRFDGLEDRSFRPYDNEAEPLEWHGPKGKLPEMVSDAISTLENKEYEAEKTRWIEAHGSDRLRRAWSAGHNSQRGYVTERAALEVPGWTVDFDDTLESKGRSYPTAAALDMLDKSLPLAKALGVQVVIEWITEVDDEEGECEGLVMRGYLPRHSTRDGYTLYWTV